MVLQPEKKQMNSIIVEESLYVTSYSDFASYGDIARHLPIHYSYLVCYKYFKRVAKEIHNYTFNNNRKILLQNILICLYCQKALFGYDSLLSSLATHHRWFNGTENLSLCIRWLQWMTKWLIMWKNAKRNGDWGLSGNSLAWHSGEGGFLTGLWGHKISKFYWSFPQQNHVVLMPKRSQTSRALLNGNNPKTRRLSSVILQYMFTVFLKTETLYFSPKSMRSNISRIQLKTHTKNAQTYQWVNKTMFSSLHIQ